MLTATEVAAALRISTRQVQRLGLPYTPVGKRGKRYDLAECQRHLRETQCPSNDSQTVRGMLRSASGANDYIAACRQVHLRVTPSSSKPSSSQPSANGSRPSLVTRD